MTIFIFKEIFFFFYISIPGGISLTNKHMFIFNGHGSRATFEVIEQAQQFGLDMHGYLTFTYIPCIVAFGHNLIQTFQDCF